MFTLAFQSKCAFQEYLAVYVSLRFKKTTSLTNCCRNLKGKADWSRDVVGVTHFRL